jgi:hypothetical protein
MNEVVGVLSDASLPLRTALPTDLTYIRAARNVYSQNGEDGILEKLIDDLGLAVARPGWTCEFGGADGHMSSNTLLLNEARGWGGLVIEADSRQMPALRATHAARAAVHVRHGFVLPKPPAADASTDAVGMTLTAWLDSVDAPPEPDVVSIDVDGDDIYIAETFFEDGKYHPSIIVIEANTYREAWVCETPSEPFTELDGSDLLARWRPDRVACGSSVLSILELGLRHGYTPVAFTGNWTFVRSDLAQALLPRWPDIRPMSQAPTAHAHLVTHLVLWNSGSTAWCTNTALIHSIASMNARLHDTGATTPEAHHAAVLALMRQHGERVWTQTPRPLAVAPDAGDVPETGFVRWLRTACPEAPLNRNSQGQAVLSLPSWVRRVRLDIGLSYSAPISQQWLSQAEAEDCADLIVIGVEPNPQSCASICRFGSPHWTSLQPRYIREGRFLLLPCALGDVPPAAAAVVTMPLHVTANDPGCSSLFRPVDFEVLHVAQVPVFAAEDIVRLLPLDVRVDYVKIDAQGADTEILRSFHETLAARGLRVTAEAEDVQYANTRNSEKDIARVMTSAGFTRCATSSIDATLSADDPSFVNSRFQAEVARTPVSPATTLEWLVASVNQHS